MEKEKTYKVGDTGPAGGIIFHDEGNSSGGWQYLEAAPVETEFKAEWGSYKILETKDKYGQYEREYISIVDTSEAIGSGKRNTGIIVKHLQELGETGRAAQVPVNLNYGGFSDWFLPSKDELNLMYQNLRQKEIGDFSNDWYWSSTEYNPYNACYQHFGKTHQYYKYKDYMNLVRAVRAF